MIIQALIIFSLLIITHELGHFMAAKWAGVTVLEFSIGMGPAIFTKKIKGTVYSLRILPIGGYVRMDGENGDESEGEGENTLPPVDRTDVKGVPFTQVSPLKRAIILVAGAFMNIASALFITFFVVGATNTIVTPVIDSFKDENLSASYGIQLGDEVTKIGNNRVNISTDIIYILMRTNGEPVDVTVKRDGKTILLPDVAFPTATEQGMTISLPDFFCVREKLNPLNLIHESFFRCVSIIREVYAALWGLITGQVPMTQLSGPVATTQAIGEIAKQGIDSLIYFMIFISINIGIVNLVPFPALDGGRLLLLLIEVVRGKPMKPEHEGMINFVGFALLMLLIVVVTFNDVSRLIGG